jgi:hypothetical protein
MAGRERRRGECQTLLVLFGAKAALRPSDRPSRGQRRQSDRSGVGERCASIPWKERERFKRKNSGRRAIEAVPPHVGKGYYLRG